MVSETVTGVSAANGPVAVAVTSIRQDEPTLLAGTGSADTCPDGKGVGSSTAQVRAERAGNVKVPGDGRVYHIGFTATDPGGNRCTGEVLVCVPHDQGQRMECVDEGPLYDSTRCPGRSSNRRVRHKRK